MKKIIGLLAVGILLFVMGCSQAEPVVQPVTLPDVDSAQPVEPKPAAAVPLDAALAIEEPLAEPVVEEPEEKLLPGYAKLGMGDSSDKIEIIDWGIEVGRKDSAKLLNVTFLVRNTGREPISGQILFEAWENEIFYKKTYDIGRDIPPGQSYFFTEYMEETLDAPKQQKQMRAVFINVDAGKTMGEDHVFFVPIK